MYGHLAFAKIGRQIGRQIDPPKKTSINPRVPHCTRDEKLHPTQHHGEDSEAGIRCADVCENIYPWPVFSLQGVVSLAFNVKVILFRMELFKLIPWYYSRTWLLSFVTECKSRKMV